VATRVSRLEDGVRFRVRLTPRGGRDSLEGWAEGADGAHLKARVRAAPENGEANAALLALLANRLGVARTSLALERGGKTRIKTVRAAGEPQKLAALLETLGETK
jgi:uncharacterized protein YggU (UPF0235/DUF167 family)